MRRIKRSGIVMWFRPDGIGFITEVGKENPILVHYSAIRTGVVGKEKNLKPGQKVRFDAVQVDNKEVATDVWAA